MVSETVEAEGHLIDTGNFQSILTTVVEHGSEYEILRFAIGRKNEEASHLTLKLTAATGERLQDLLAKLSVFGCFVKGTPQAVLRARDYLHAHSAEDISLAALAEAAGMDRFRLTRAFRSAFGLPPHAYLVQWRLVQARRLLRQGLAPASVAATVGFADQSHLGRWFRRAFGLTPAHYRRLCSNVPD